MCVSTIYKGCVQRQLKLNKFKDKDNQVTHNTGVTKQGRSDIYVAW